MKCSKEMKSSNAGNEIKTKHKWSDHGTVAIAAPGETLDLQAETLREAALATNEQSNHEEKEQDVPEEEMLARISHHRKSLRYCMMLVEDKIGEAGSR